MPEIAAEIDAFAVLRPESLKLVETRRPDGQDLGVALHAVADGLADHVERLVAEIADGKHVRLGCESRGDEARVLAVGQRVVAVAEVLQALFLQHIFHVRQEAIAEHVLAGDRVPLLGFGKLLDHRAHRGVHGAVAGDGPPEVGLVAVLAGRLIGAGLLHIDAAAREHFLLHGEADGRVGTADDVLDATLRHGLLHLADGLARIAAVVEKHVVELLAGSGRVFLDGPLAAVVEERADVGEGARQGVDGGDVQSFALRRGVAQVGRHREGHRWCGCKAFEDASAFDCHASVLPG